MHTHRYACCTHPTLSMALLACIRMLVSQKTHCAYCIDFNAALLVNRLGWTDQEILEGLNHCATLVAGDILINAFKVERDF